MEGFRRIKTRDSWSRRKKMPGGFTALIEFWDDALDGVDYGIWIHLIPPGGFKAAVRWDGENPPVTGNGDMSHVPFFLTALDDFLRQMEPGERVQVTGADNRRASLYTKLLTRRGFQEVYFESDDPEAERMWMLLYEKPGAQKWPPVLDVEAEDL